MSGYYVKNPGTVLDLTFDWGTQHLDSGETISTDQGWTVHPDDAGTGGLSVQSNTNTTTTTTAFLQGGRPGDAYLVSSSILTSNGREFRRAMTVRAANI